MIVPFLGFIAATAVLSAVAVLLTGLLNTAMLEIGRHHPPPVMARTVKVEVQRQSPLAKETPPAKDAREASAAMDVSPVVSTAKANTKKRTHHKPKTVARQYNNYGYWNARGYAEGYGSRFFR